MYLNGLAADGNSWCAGFVSYCFSHSGVAMPFRYSVGAQDILGQFKKKGWVYAASATNPPEPGDIIVFTRATKKEPWLGHIGLVHGYADGIVTTIEGNRGPFPSMVSSFTYVLGRIENLLGFGQAQP
jgi:hypothetical protein